MFKLITFFSLLFTINGEFIFPNDNSELYIDQQYNITWYENLTDYHIYLLHHDSNSIITNSLSTYENGDLILDDIVENNNYVWKPSRNLNKYDLGNHNFKIVITNSEGFSSSLTNTNNDYIISDYFSIKTNMNITKPQKDIVIYPNNNATIEWNGFIGNIDMVLEYNKGNKWKKIFTIENNFNTDKINNYLWEIQDTVNDYSNFKMRFKLQEKDTDIERYSESFYSYGLKLVNPIINRYDFIDRIDNFINISWQEYNDKNINLEVRLLDENNNFIKLLTNNVSNNYYLWNLNQLDYNKIYKIQLNSNNLNLTSNIFLIDHLSTTVTTDSLTSTTTTVTTYTLTSTTTTVTTDTLTSTTVTTDTLTTSNTNAITSNTFTSKTTKTFPITSNLDKINISDMNPPIIIEDKNPPTLKEKNIKNKRDFIWLIIIGILSLFIIILFIIYSNKKNKISNIDLTPQTNRNIMRYPLYNKNDNMVKKNNILYDNQQLDNTYNENYNYNNSYQTVPNFYNSITARQERNCQNQIYQNPLDYKKKIQSRIMINKNYGEVEPINL